MASRTRRSALRLFGTRRSDPTVPGGGGERIGRLPGLGGGALADDRDGSGEGDGGDGEGDGEGEGGDSGGGDRGEAVATGGRLIATPKLAPP